MADKKAPEAVRSLHKVYCGVKADPTTDPRKQNSVNGENGRADLMVVKGGRGVYIEVKGAVADSISLWHWPQHQREWAATYALPEPYSTEYWLWFYLGADPPHYNPEKYSPRKTWLVPYGFMTNVHRLIEPIQDTLVYKLTKHHSLALREKNYDAIHLLAQWELKWAGNNTWSFPDSHPFTQKYLTAKPLFETIGELAPCNQPSQKTNQ
jgi:hypothetical protein